MSVKLTPTHDLDQFVVMSRAVSEPASLETALGKVAAAAAKLLEAEGAMILVGDERERLQAVCSHGAAMEEALHCLAGACDHLLLDALSLQRPVWTSDIRTDRRHRPWQNIAGTAGFRAFMASPLAFGQAASGTISIYRKRPGCWPSDAADFLSLAGRYAASAVHAHGLREGQRLRVETHSRMIRGLSDQRYAQIERLSALGSSLESHNRDRLNRMIAKFTAELTEFYGEAVRHIDNALIASVLLAEASIARRKGMTLTLNTRSRQTDLPPRLGEIETSNLISNLLEAAFDAIAEVSTSHGRVSLLIRSDETQALLRVRTRRGALRADCLASARALVEATGGRLEARRFETGSVCEVLVPGE